MNPNDELVAIVVIIAEGSGPKLILVEVYCEADNGYVDD